MPVSRSPRTSGSLNPSPRPGTRGPSLDLSAGKLTVVKKLPGQVEELRALVQEGLVLVAGDADYEAERGKSWNLDCEGSPAAVVMAGSESDVVAVVNYARDHACTLCIAGGRFSRFSFLDHSLVLDLSKLCLVQVSAVSQIAIVQAGARMHHIDSACEASGLAMVLGHNSNIGIGGLALGGGVGWLSRLHGLTADSLLSARIVLATGQVVDVSNDKNSDLFWALRGGGGNFGVVVEFSFQVYPVGSQGQVVTYNVEYHKQEYKTLKKLMTPFGRCIDPVKAAIIHRNFQQNAHYSKATSAAFMFLGRSACVRLFYIHGETVESGKEVMNDVKRLTGGKKGKVKTVSYHSEVQKNKTFNNPPDFYYETSAMLFTLPDDAIKMLYEQAQSAPNENCTIVLYQMGGKLSEYEPNACPFWQRKIAYWVFMLAQFKPNEDSSKSRSLAQQWTRQTRDLLNPWVLSTYNVLDRSVESKYGPTDADQMDLQKITRLYGVNLSRLVSIKRIHDPTNLFRNNNNIDPVSVDRK
mmetsp:Transcript_26144/g.36105  ORF Transcript_26144/g.36105 Transcript_26144/m.36105 type:complete len:524 (+) Transcript_26144:198-1769(+)|eukprot:CAMPEP_0196592376 /NCGR_PEP_ID=MMETSP1081-20130531/72579_1 /TAXON_ID=36882 /ORGANISM="Pyramimonas amylifera, Strain CCMP720" /LENGTH=523 /DNA_ID=CAMNT_0041916053 /DNA_START=169 /DNA_END=1740 /DNA_ORIENTATION=+